jgi:hypothetical protein
MVEVEIYISNLIKFFKNNPNDLLNLIPEEKKEEFFQKIKEVAINNYEKGNEVSLTQKQLIGVCLEITKSNKLDTKQESFFQETKFGRIYLN